MQRLRAYLEDLQRCYSTQSHFLMWIMARILHDVSGKRWWEYPGLKDFFFKPWNQQLRRLLRKIQISCPSNSPLLGKRFAGIKEMGENRYLLGCYYCQLKRPPLHWKEKIPVAASLQKLEQEVLHCVELSWLQSLCLDMSRSSYSSYWCLPFSLHINSSRCSDVLTLATPLE